MAYRVYADGNLICSPNNEQTALDSPTLTLEANKAGTFSFTMLPDHPFYDRINLRTSLIDVYQDWELIFEGVPVSESSDFYNRKTFECEGDLAFLNDTIQRLAVHEGMTPQTLLARYLATHNEQADANKQFQVGVVTVQGSNIYRYTNYQTTMTEIAEDLIENFGGYLRVRHEGGVRYLDYLAESPRASAQSIRIGKNLIDLSKNLNTLDICTVLIPLGAKTGTLDNIDTRLDIKTVNGGLDYLVGTGAAYYGNIWRTQTWDDVTIASNLKAKGQAYLDSVQWANLVIEATALDLGLTEEDVEQFRVLDTIRVVSEPHGLDRTFLLTKLQIDLNHPGDTQVTLGHDERLSLSKQTAQAAAKIEQAKTEIIATASENTRQILDAATDGAIQILYNENGVAYELRINNSQNPATATKWWRYNSAGWGYTADGGQTYTIAATMDGAFLANFITAGVLRSQNGKFSLDMETGTANLANANITGGSIRIVTDSQAADAITLLFGDYGSAMYPDGFVASKTNYGSFQMRGDDGFLVYGADDRIRGRMWLLGSSDQDLWFTLYGGQPGDYANRHGVDIIAYGTGGGRVIVNNPAGNPIVDLDQNSSGHGLINLSDDYRTRVALSPNGLFFYDANGVQRCRISPTGGLYFYNSSGTLTKSYPAT